MTSFNLQREAMVDGQLRPNKVNVSSLLYAFETCPREAFLSAALQPIAYVDQDLTLGAGRTLIEPVVLARLLQSVSDWEDRDCLVLGEPTGYTAAILSHLSPTVICADTAEQLEGTAGRLSAEGYDSVVCETTDDLRGGLAAFSPYGAIVIPAGVDQVPPAILEQLRDGGVVLTVEIDRPSRAVKLTMVAGEVGQEILFDANTPRLSEFALEQGFTF